MPDGNYRLGNFEVTVKDGVARDPEGKLAGSTLTLDRALRELVAIGVPLRDVDEIKDDPPFRAHH